MEKITFKTEAGQIIEIQTPYCLEDKTFNLKDKNLNELALLKTNDDELLNGYLKAIYEVQNYLIESELKVYSPERHEQRKVVLMLSDLNNLVNVLKKFE